jgi:C1A family cysteine protease
MKKLIISTLALTISSLTWADDIAEVHTSNQDTQFVRLMPIKLPSNSAQKITQSLEKKSPILMASYGEATSIKLGMNNVPVLNQGMHGTCATFAVTGALDALMGKGDYISQVCHLTLGQYLSTHAYQLSGWDGAYADNVLSQVNTYGIINKDKEKTQGCAGLTQYPALDTTSPVNEMSVDAFHQLSEEASGIQRYDVTKVLDFYEFISREKTPADVIKTIKSSLSKGDRLVFGVIVTTADGVGTYGKYHQKEDSWVITPEVISAIKSDNYGGHAMIITGYDDNAVATDIHGKTHKGLFILRNSWGKNAGDEGNYYMSYDYMANLGYDITRIRKLAK